MDANYPYQAIIDVWCDLEKDKVVKGISCHWFDSPTDRQRSNRHWHAAGAVIEDISGIDPARKVLYPDKDGGQHGVYRKAGYILELQGTLNSDAKKPSFVNMLYILRDKTWYD